MNRGRFNSVEEKRKFLRQRRKEKRLAKDALGNLQADCKDFTSRQGKPNVRSISQGGLPQ